MATRVVELSSGGYKIRKINFWSNGELSKIGHHFSNKVILKIDFIENVNNKKIYS